MPNTTRAIGSIVGTDALTTDELFNITLSIQATDGTEYVNGSVMIQVATGLSLSSFNAAVIQGVKDYVDTHHSWNIQKSKIFVPQWHKGLL